MLSSILSKQTCASCRFCCSFRRQSLWETPLMPPEFKESHTKDCRGQDIRWREESTLSGTGSTCCSPDLTDAYTTDDPEEEAPCPFLDRSKGCTLSEQEKPFDCKIWPLRCMRMQDGTLAVCLTPTCPAVNAVPPETVQQLVTGGLGKIIADYAAACPYIIKPYHEGFPVLMRLNS